MKHAGEGCMILSKKLNNQLHYILTTIMFVFVLLSCNKGIDAGDLTGSSSKKSSNKEERPHESGEGLPGYLIEPSAITIAKDKLQVHIKGGEGAIVKETSDGKRVYINVVQLEKNNFDITVKEDNQVISGQYIGNITPAVNGSFDKIFIINNDGPVVITISDIKKSNDIKLSDGPKISSIFKSLTSDLPAQSFTRILAENLTSFSKADLKKIQNSKECIRCNLRGADLSHMDLSSGSYMYTDFSHCNLRKTNFFGANLSFAIFTGTNLSEANTTDTNISEAKLP